MDILLDTHALIWFIEGNNKLSSVAKQAIENHKNNYFFSIASIWEISIKESLGKISLNASLEKIIDIIHQNNIEILPITTSHLITLNKLEFHHKDPFDRLIISQAMVNGCSIVTKDQFFPLYDVPLIW